jgi:uncharacterized phage protein (predicted DNA packaging)
MSLITLEQAKLQCRIVHDEDDDEIQEMIDAASVSIISYMGSASEIFVDTSGEVAIGAVPADVQMACKLEVAHLYKNREGQSDSKIPEQFGYGYPLCAAAIAKLFHYRTLTLA